MAGNKFLLDTNAIIALQRENEALKKLLGTATDVFVPAVAVGELYYGALATGHQTKVRTENSGQGVKES